MHHLLITPLAPIHARQAARLHIQGQPGTFLTGLGEDVLTAVYRALPQSRGGFGFAALQLPDHNTEQAAEPSLVGYVSATTGIGGLFLEMASQRLGELLPPLLRRYGQDPRLALRSMQTALYPFLMQHEDDGEPAAELLSIMVEPVLRSYGVGDAADDRLSARMQPPRPGIRHGYGRRRQRRRTKVLSTPRLRCLAQYRALWPADGGLQAQIDVIASFGAICLFRCGGRKFCHKLSKHKVSRIWRNTRCPAKWIE